MKAIYIDCFGGAAGDMLIGALIDLGAEKELIEHLPGRLGLKGVTAKFSRVERHGISGTKFDLTVATEQKHRHLKHVNEIIESSDLSDWVKEKSQAAFTLLAESEAHVHNSTIEKVHFHEVGADDAIIDIVGYFLLLEAMGKPRVYCSPPVLGRGIIKAAHGMIPLPGPAVTEIFRNVAVKFIDFEGETVTPTGAALLKTSATFESSPQMKILMTGYGAGTKEYHDRPNLLRVILGELEGETLFDAVTVMETNIDDMNPQLFEPLFANLYAAGALEVFIVPTIMKKSRPGFLLTVLAKKSVAPKLTNIIFAETTTAGLRIRESERMILERREEVVATTFGDVRIKVLSLAEGEKYIPEFEDCRRLALEHNVPVATVMAAVQRLYPQKG